jgi:hypothetical protein
MTDATWSVEILFREDEDRTRADAMLVTPSGHHHGWGRARLAPGDADVPVIGEELAAARALSDLAHQLLDAAADQIEERTGEHPVLR